MVEVRVRDQDHVNGGQIAQMDSGLAQPFQDKQPAGEIGIDQNILAAHLQKEAGVADESQSQLSVGGEFGFMGLAGARGNRGMTHQAAELLSPFAEDGIA